MESVANMNQVFSELDSLKNLGPMALHSAIDHLKDCCSLSDDQAREAVRNWLRHLLHQTA